MQLGVFARLWQIALELYDDLVGLDWRWQSVDGAMTKAPLGGESTGKNPMDRAKSGTKRSLLTEAAGIPTGLAVGGASGADSLLDESISSNSGAMGKKTEQQHRRLTPCMRLHHI